MKAEVPLNKAQWIIEPGCVVLVTSGNTERRNVMTFSWQTPINCSSPCLVLLVIHHERYSYELIKENKELVINVPGEHLLDQTQLAGVLTGWKTDKFAETGLTPVPAAKVAPPLIDQCAGHLECRVVDIYEMDPHDLLICEVLHASADSDLFDGKWIPEKFSTLHYLGGTSYGIMERAVRANVKTG